MESNYKLIKKFLSQEESNQILNWIETIDQDGGAKNHHLDVLGKSLKGKSNIFDISKTDLTKYITNFQSVSDVSTNELPDFIHKIIDRLSETFGLSKNNIFLQAVDMNKGGKINPHYDASLDGYINYKCNISILSEDYSLHVGENVIEISQSDLYCFEASLYKHWTKEFNSRRVFLSFGFIVPYSELNRSENDPRVRLSKRIEKYFQNN